ncbi:tRNA (adenosine(37)-N6)-threonylcarbamoyltransferase complex transferase subunit TsaD [Adlercreutzia sp. R21]|uniref:tRNA (adenosine(37)-N6)-threonylcarbamoyltransferase complex transferase subunit TsaD n=1 Tax=Adlercreutzia wanghongyangiae TaxID=3111451 RepID=UPI002DBC2E5B|nr:tRNA (adenosine(37)-N6)-threonylcarbamoyltransferase complex transferase subunit TsaD [Adlercreutzia sp. R21]MEC4184372.1 tRNA (adenosine(37)-N6)-threonylcarbamoyltransferase complex transferase subunit TsaD [Adlercreutzia sp. R21]
MDGAASSFVLAFDTANEVIAIGLGRLCAASREIELVAGVEVEARRASNTQLLPRIDELCARAGVARGAIACVCVGRGPGSFTGVRIALATAKGIASALEVGLAGVSSLDAVAWGAWAAGERGELLVLADAMRREVYPVEYRLDAAGATRLTADRVVKATVFAEEIGTADCPPAPSGNSSARDVCDGTPDTAHDAACDTVCDGALDAACNGTLRRGGLQAALPTETAEHSDGSALLIAGDALRKYRELFEGAGTVLPEALWTPTGAGLLLALQAAWRADECDPLDAARHNPGALLPVYTRLSDAEESERVRLAQADAALAGKRGSKHVTMNDTAIANARANGEGIAYKPLDARHVDAVAALESQVMGSDAWSAALVGDELGRADRVWWAAYAADPKMPLTADAPLVGYAGGWVVDGDVQILKVGVDPAWRRHGIARALLARVADDARNLGASTSSLEVRATNEGAQALYEALGYEALGVRPRYYSDGEDAVIMRGPLPAITLAAVPNGGGVADDPRRGGACAALGHEDGAAAARPGCASGPGAAEVDPYGENGGVAVDRPLILAIESSCDETAAAVINGEEALLSDVVASQVDFHARFGGVVPEIASRKHIEAICGVCDEALDAAARVLLSSVPLHHPECSAQPGVEGLSDNAPRLRWRDLDAVAVTYAPGLVGALVVGVAFAKGAAWGADIPFIVVNHLEGHLYANKIGLEDFRPPAVVSLVSGGNTLLVYMADWGDYRVLGATIDDAVGEAFDKVAKALGLGYPGGPVVSKFAAEGDSSAISFPRAMLHSGDFSFSLSGLKTAVVTYINNERAAGRALNVPDICASFTQAVVDVQVAKARTALRETGAPTFCLGGGVAANPTLRQAYETMCAEEGVRLVMPPLASCGDNAGMIAEVALDRYRAGKFSPLSTDALAQGDLEMPY